MKDTHGIEIGSWLYDKNGIAKQVTEVYDDSVTMGGELHHVSTVQPIPLDGKVLMRAGFEETFASPFANEYRLDLGDYFLIVKFLNYSRRYVSVYYNPNHTAMAIDVRKDDFAVHELQNLFTLFGIRKEIRV